MTSPIAFESRISASSVAHKSKTELVLEVEARLRAEAMDRLLSVGQTVSLKEMR